MVSMDQDDASEAGEEGHEETEPAAQPCLGLQIKLNKFGGFRSEFRGRRDEVQDVSKLHSVPEDKQVLLLYFAFEAGKGRPRDLFPAYSVDEVAAFDPADIWKRLNKEYEEEKYIEAEEALADYDKYRTELARLSHDVAACQSSDATRRPW